MSTNDALILLRSVVREIAQVDIDGLARTTTFTELDIDSLTVVEITTAMEESLGAKIPADVFAELATIGELEEQVVRMAGGPEAAMSPST
ncbi:MULTISPECIES: acyl carrier protein [unclassified Frankia]|uniref:acyl carrier protein n=1 Tax=unclassified Frankia TaxID=2632575 RepID=UPI001EF4E57A|nr:MULTISPECIES: acyl carrier protein [unclassified Frankia]